MRTVLFVTVIHFILGTSLYGQGISFQEGTWNDIKDMALKSDKHILVDVYTDWCAPCKKMNKEVFRREEVGAAINPHFISIKVNAEKGEGKSLAREWNVQAYPTILYFDPSGQEVTRFTGMRGKDAFMEYSNEVLLLNEVVLYNPDSIDVETASSILLQFKQVDIENKELYLNKWWLNLSEEEKISAESIKLIRANMQHANVDMIKTISKSIIGYDQIKFVSDLNRRMSLLAESDDLISINALYEIQLEMISNSLFASSLKPEVHKNYDKVRLKLYKKHPKYDARYLELSKEMMNKYVMNLALEDVRRMEKTLGSPESYIVSKKLVNNIQEITYNFHSKYDDPATLSLALSWLEHGQQLYYDDQTTIIQSLIQEKMGNESKALELLNKAKSNEKFETLKKQLGGYLN